MSPEPERVILCHLESAGACGCEKCEAQSERDELRRRVSELEAGAGAGGWIACSERMPEIYQNVIVAGGVAQYQGGSRFDSLMENPPRPIEWVVTHWMPLPKAPSEKGEA